jgi:hypothetical protein
LNHFASRDFWELLDGLPPEVQKVARANFDLLKADPRHPSLHLKKIGSYWSVRAGRGYRALGTDVEGGILWGWIGSHAEYDKIVG